MIENIAVLAADAALKLALADPVDAFIESKGPPDYVQQDLELRA